MNKKEKQKAEEILIKFENLDICLSYDGAIEKSKREAVKNCALILCDEVLENIDITFKNPLYRNWENVRKEIEKY